MLEPIRLSLEGDRETVRSLSGAGIIVRVDRIDGDVE